MKVLINYASARFRQSQRLNSRTGIEVGGFDRVMSFGPGDIDRDFFGKNETILSQERGNGYWLWKPYVMLKAMETVGEGDWLFYCDSGAHFIGPIEPIIELALTSGQDIVPFELDQIEKGWTKRDAFILMGCDSQEFTESQQRLGGFILVRKSEFACGFLREYLEFAQNARIITDCKNTLGLDNYPGFREHRHDQSIFSLLTKKHGLAAYRDPSQFGNVVRHLYPNSGYDQILVLTRNKGWPSWDEMVRGFFRQPTA